MDVNCSLVNSRTINKNKHIEFLSLVDIDTCKNITIKCPECKYFLERDLILDLAAGTARRSRE